LTQHSSEDLQNVRILRIGRDPKKGIDNTLILKVS